MSKRNREDDDSQSFRESADKRAKLSKDSEDADDASTDETDSLTEDPWIAEEIDRLLNEQEGDELFDRIERLSNPEDVLTDDDNSDWNTIPEIRCSCSESAESSTSSEPFPSQERNVDDDGGEGSSSKLRVEKKKPANSEGPQPSTSAPDPEPEVNKSVKRPKVSDLKINPKNYIPPQKGERSDPPTFYAHSDEDSDNEGRPKKNMSEEQLTNITGRYALNRPVKKKDDNVEINPNNNDQD